MPHPAALFLALVLALSLFCRDAARAEEPSGGIGALDGMVFVGRIGPEGDLDLEEELHFSDRVFWSRRCLACGFDPAPYQSRQTPDGVRFTGELVGRSGSVFQYDGRIVGAEAEVAVRWTKKRWYRTIDRMLVFRGQRAPDTAALTGDGAAQEASAARRRPLPGWCP